MKSFTDNKGRRWLLEINVGALKRIRALCDGFDVLNLVQLDSDGTSNADGLERLSSDPILLVDVIYAVCKPEADALGVSDEDFGSAMVGDVITDATNQLLDAIVDFFPEAKRLLFQKTLRAARRFAEKNTQTLLTMLNDPNLDKELENRLESRVGTLKDTFISAPGSQE